MPIFDVVCGDDPTWRSVAASTPEEALRIAIAGLEWEPADEIATQVVLLKIGDLRARRVLHPPAPPCVVSHVWVPGPRRRNGVEERCEHCDVTRISRVTADATGTAYTSRWYGYVP